MSKQGFLEFGQRLKAMREQKGIQQGQLAKAADVSRQSMSSYESGRYSPDVIAVKRMAECLGCSVDYLLGLSGVGNQIVNKVTTREELSQVIGTRLQRLRKAKGYQQQEIADVLGLKKQTISGYEVGRFLPDFLVLMSLATFYGVSLDYICGRVDAENQMVTNASVQTITPRELSDLTENLRMAKKALAKLENMEAILTHLNENIPD